MTYRPYPNRDRAEKYATRHGKPSGWSRPFRVRRKRFSLEPLLVDAVWSQEEQDRMRRLVDSLPSGTYQFTGYLQGPDDTEEQTA